MCLVYFCIILVSCKVCNDSLLKPLIHLGLPEGLFIIKHVWIHHKCVLWFEVNRESHTLLLVANETIVNCPQCGILSYLTLLLHPKLTARCCIIFFFLKRHGNIYMEVTSLKTLAADHQPLVDVIHGHSAQWVCSAERTKKHSWSRYS